MKLDKPLSEGAGIFFNEKKNQTAENVRKSAHLFNSAPQPVSRRLGAFFPNARGSRAPVFPWPGPVAGTRSPTFTGPKGRRSTGRRHRARLRRSIECVPGVVIFVCQPCGLVLPDDTCNEADSEEPTGQPGPDGRPPPRGATLGSHLRRRITLYHRYRLGDNLLVRHRVLQNVSCRFRSHRPLNNRGGSLRYITKPSLLSNRCTTARASG